MSICLSVPVGRAFSLGSLAGHSGNAWGSVLSLPMSIKDMTPGSFGAGGSGLLLVSPHEDCLRMCSWLPHGTRGCP